MCICNRETNSHINYVDNYLIIAISKFRQKKFRHGTTLLPVVESRGYLLVHTFRCVGASTTVKQCEAERVVQGLTLAVNTLAVKAHPWRVRKVSLQYLFQDIICIFPRFIIFRPLLLSASPRLA